MRISRVQYSIFQAIILLLMIAGLLYLYVSVATNITQKNAQLKHKQHSSIILKNSES